MLCLFRQLCRLTLIVILALWQMTRVVKSYIQKAASWLNVGGLPRTKQRGKKPSALQKITVVFTEDAFEKKELNKVAEVVFWCVNLGCKYIFLYDPSGVLKRNRSEISELMRKSSPDLTLHFTSGWSKGSLKDKITVHALDKEDSMAPLLHVASKSIHVDEYHGLEDVNQYWSTDLNFEKLSEEMSVEFGDASILAPDMILVIGPIFTLNGCPPFHARISEIYYLGRLHHLTLGKFGRSLGKYWNTRQRFGA